MQSKLANSCKLLQSADGVLSEEERAALANTSFETVRDRCLALLVLYILLLLALVHSNSTVRRRALSRVYCFRRASSTENASRAQQIRSPRMARLLRTASGLKASSAVPRHQTQEAASYGDPQVCACAHTLFVTRGAHTTSCFLVVQPGSRRLTPRSPPFALGGLLPPSLVLRGCCLRL